MSDFAVIVVQSPSTTSMTSVNAECEISIARAEELRELERELECPVCMDISHPPI
jgi:cytochrome c-type biogenesis protein CcmH/NrfF